MNEKEQLKLMLKKYLDVRLTANTDGDGDVKIDITVFFEGEEITSAYDYIMKRD